MNWKEAFAKLDADHALILAAIGQPPLVYTDAWPSTASIPWGDWYYVSDPRQGGFRHLIMRAEHLPPSDPSGPVLLRYGSASYREDDFGGVWWVAGPIPMMASGLPEGATGEPPQQGDS